MPGYNPLMLPSQHTGSAGALLLVLVPLTAELLPLALFQRHQVVFMGAALGLSSTCVMQVMVLKLLKMTGQAMPPTFRAVMALFPAAAELGNPLPLIVTTVPPTKLPVLGLTESTCAYTWNMRGAGLAGVAVMKARLLRASPPAKRPSKLTVTFASPATPTPIWGSPCSSKRPGTQRSNTARHVDCGILQLTFPPVGCCGACAQDALRQSCRHDPTQPSAWCSGACQPASNWVFACCNCSRHGD